MLNSRLDLSNDLPNNVMREHSFTQTQVLQIVIAEQNRLQAEALSLICAEMFPGAALRSHGHGMEALQSLRTQPVDLLLLGLTFEDMDGVDVLNEIRLTARAVRVVLLSERRDEHVLLSLRTARFDGAVDLFTEPVDAVKQALHRVVEGRGYISPTLRRYLIDALPENTSSDELTATEVRVLRVIGDGTDNLEAAQKLGISDATVQTHRRNIMRKLRVPTSAKLVREAVRLGVVRIPLATVMQRPQLALFPREAAHRAK